MQSVDYRDAEWDVLEYFAENVGCAENEVGFAAFFEGGVFGEADAAVIELVDVELEGLRGGFGENDGVVLVLRPFRFAACSHE